MSEFIVYLPTASDHIVRIKKKIISVIDFDIVGDIQGVEPIAVGRGIRDLSRLTKQYGQGNWRKLKGFASVRLIDDTIHTAEIHWYEAHGIGKKEFKLKFPLID